MDDRKQITYRLWEARLESGKSFRQIAEETGLSLNVLNAYMNKGVMPGADSSISQRLVSSMSAGSRFIQHNWI